MTLWQQFYNCFNHMPIVALIDEKMNSITPEKVIETKEEPVQIKAEEVKVEDKEAAPAPVQPKVKSVQKEAQTDK